MGDYNFKKIKGLTANDRALWEKKNLNALKEDKNRYLSRSDAEREILFKNYAFKDRFGKEEDYQTLKTLTPEQRDSVFMADVMGKPRKPVTPNSSLNSNIPTSVTEESVEPSSTEQKFDTTKMISNPDATINTDTVNKSQFDLKKVVEDPKFGLFEDEYNQRKTKYNESPTTTDSRFRTIAEEKSPYFKMYKDSNYLPLSAEQKADLLAEYDAQVNTYGQEQADKVLRDRIQNVADSNQSFLEKSFRTVRGMGANGAATTIAIAGLMKATINTLAKEDSTTEDMNFIEELGYRIGTDSWMKEADEIMKTGAWKQDIQDKWKESGLNRNEIILSSEASEDPLGHIFDDLDIIPTALQQYGFTIASSLLSFGVSGVMTKLATPAVTKIATKQAAKQALAKGISVAEQTAKNLERVNKTMNYVNPIVTNGIVSSGEAALNGIDAYNNTLEEGYNIAERAFDDIAREETKKRLIEAGLMRPDKIDEESFNLTKEQVANELRNQGVEDDLRAEAQRKAGAAASTVTLINSAINGAINASLKSFIHAPAVKEQMRRIKPFKNIGVDFKSTPTGKIVAKGLQTNIGASMLAGTKGMLGEGLEEGLQSATGKASQAVFTENLTDVIDHKYFGKGKDTMVENIVNDLGTFAKVFGKSMTERDTMYEMVLGAISTGIGGPNINLQRHGSKERQEGESWLKWKNRTNLIQWQNPLVQDFSEHRQQSKELKEQAEILTKYFQDPVNKAKFDGTAGTMNWINQMETAAAQGDEFNYRNSLLGKQVNDVLTLNKIKGTQYYDSTIETLENVASAEEGSQAAQNIISQLRQDYSNRGYSDTFTDEQLLTQAKENATKTLDLIDKVDKETTELNQTIGDNVSDDVKNALIYGKLSIDNWNEREKQLNEEIAKIQIPNSVEPSNINSDYQSLIAKYGSFDKAASSFKDTKKNIDESKQQEQELQKLLKKAKSENYRNQLSEAITLLKAVQNTNKKDAKNIETQLYKVAEVAGNTDIVPVLSETEILKLDALDRAEILNPKNLDKYSKEQQEIIKNVIDNATIQDKGFDSKIQDAYKVRAAKENFLKEYNNTLRDPSLLNAYEQKLKNKVEQEDRKKKFAHVNEIQDYSTFVDKITELEAKETYSNIDSYFRNNPLYQRYKETDSFITTLQKQVEDETNDVEKNLLGEIVADADRNNINYKDVGAVRKMIVYNSQDQMYKGVELSVALGTFSNAIDKYEANQKELQKIINPQPPTSFPQSPVTPVVPPVSSKTESPEVTPQEKPLSDNVKNYQSQIDILQQEKESKQKEISEWQENLNNQIAGTPSTFDFNGQTHNIGLTALIAVNKYYDNQINDLTKKIDQEEILNSAIEQTIPETIPSTEEQKPTGTSVTKEKTPKKQESIIPVIQTPSEKALSMIDNLENTNNLYKDLPALKQEAKGILEEITDYESTQDYADLIIQESFKYQSSNQELFHLLQRLALQVAKEDKGSTTKNIKENFRSIDINSFRPGNFNEKHANRRKAEIEYYDKWNIDEFLQNNPMTIGETEVFFISDPELTKAIKRNRGNDVPQGWNSLVAVVEVPRGHGMTIGRKNYQPIAILGEDDYSNKSNTVNNANSLLPTIRQYANDNQPLGQIIKDKSGKPFTMTANIKANLPSATKEENRRDYNIKESIINDLSPKDREAFENGDTPTKQALYQKAKNAVVKRFKAIQSTNKSDNSHSFLRLRTDRLSFKGDVLDFDLMVVPISQTMTRNGSQRVIDILKNGTTPEIVKSMKRFHTFTDNIIDTFKGNPFTEDIVSNSSNNNPGLAAIEKRLQNKLNRLFRTQNYNYKLIRTDNVTPNGDVVYDLVLQGTTIDGQDNIILGQVSNQGVTEDQAVNMLKNLILENGDIRYKNNREFVIWDVNYRNMADYDNNKTYINNVIDDGLLQSSKKNFKYQIQGVNFYDDIPIVKSLPATEQVKTVANKDNATAPTPINSPTIVSGPQVTSTSGDIVDPDTGTVLVPKEEIPNTAAKTEPPEVGRRQRGRPKREPAPLEQPKVPTRGIGRKNKFFDTPGVSSEVANLGKEIIDKLKQQGYTQEAINNLTDAEIRHIKECL